MKNRQTKRNHFSLNVTLIGFTIAAVVLAGCSAALKSHRLLNDKELAAANKPAQTPPSAKAATEFLKDHSQGLAYFLPMGKLHIVATLNTSLTTNYGAATERLENGTVVTNFVTKVRVISNAVVTTSAKTNFEILHPAGSPAFSSATTTIATNKVTNDKTNTVQTTNLTVVTTAESNTAAVYYPRSTISTNTTETVTTTETLSVRTNYYYTMVLSADYMADGTQPYLVRPNTDWFHHDNMTLGVNAGLLTSVVTSNTDNTGEVLAALAQAAGQAFEMVATGGLGVPAVAGPYHAGVPKETASVDPDQVDAPGIAAELPAVNRRLSLSIPEAALQKVQTNYENWTLAARATSGAESNAIATSIVPRAEMSGTPENNVATAAKNTLTSKRAVEKSALEELKAAVIKALNSFIGDQQALDMDYLLEARIELRPKTLWLARAMQTSDVDYSNKLRVLHRMVLEDAFPGKIDRFKVPFEITPPQVGSLPPQLIDISFNPFNATEMADATNALAAGGMTLKHVENFISAPDEYQNLNAVAANETGGIYYRPALPYEITVADANNNTVSRTFLFPNKSPILHVDFNKTPFVTHVTQITMTNGFIASYGMDKPSTALAIAGLPSTIISSLTSGMTNMIQLKFNLASGQNNLKNSQLAAMVTNQAAQLQSISNTIAILSAQQKLYEALAIAKTNTPPK